MDFPTRLRVQALLASQPETSHEEHGWIDHWVREAQAILKALESAEHEA
jgi:hypothetical protein